MGRARCFAGRDRRRRRPGQVDDRGCREHPFEGELTVVSNIPAKTAEKGVVRPRFGLGRTTSVLGLVVKIICLGLVASIVISTAPAFIAAGQWMLLAATVIGAIAIFAIYTTKHAIPAKY